MFFSSSNQNIELSNENSNLSVMNNSSFVSINPGSISGCIAYWNFNTSGASCIDVIGGVVGSLSGGAQIIPGRIGSALVSTGSRSIPSEMNAGTSICNTLSGNHPFTLMMWVFANGSVEAYPNPPYDTFSNRFGGWYGGNWKGPFFRKGDEKYTATIGHGPIVNADIDFSGADRIWRHLACTGSEKSSKFYFDGELVGSMISAQNVDNGYDQAFILLHNPWDIVGIASSGTSIDEVAVFDRELTNLEIQQIYNHGYTKFHTIQSSSQNVSISNLNSSSLIIKEVE